MAGRKSSKEKTKDMPASGPFILIVDDDPDICDSVATLVRETFPSARVRTATSGAEGIKVLQKEPATMIVTDYKMPQMDGFQFLAKSKNLAPSASRVMMTAFPDPVIQAKAINEFGVQAFVPKPFEPEDMADVLRGAMGGVGRAGRAPPDVDDEADDGTPKRPRRRQGFGSVGYYYWIGRSTMNVVPWPGPALWHESEPEWSSTIPREM